MPLHAVSGAATAIQARGLSESPHDDAFYRALVEGMNDGVVTRDADGIITFASPRMCELLACTTADMIGTRGERWIEPAERASWAAQVRNCHADVEQTFELALRRKDGASIHVFISRRAVFDEAGVYCGSIALVTDVTVRRREAGILQELAETTAPLTGEEFFRSVVRYLAGSLPVQAVFVAECVDYPTTRVRILAEWDRGRHTEPREFALAGTPCNETISSGEISCLPDNLLDVFPQYAARNRASYLGVPVRDPADGRVIGHIALWDAKPLRREALVSQPIFRIFLSRIGAELRRKRADDLLRTVAGTLAPMTGEGFFRSLVEGLAKTLQVRTAFIAECLDDPPQRLSILAHWSGGQPVAPAQYPLQGMPCATVVREGREVFIPDRLPVDFPAEAAHGNQSYLGLPICDPASGQTLGHLALLDDKPMREELPADPLLRILMSRLAAEIRRKRADDTMWLVAQATAPLAGPEFFRTLARHLAKALSFREVFITECVDDSATRVRMLSHWLADDFGALDEYDLAGRPCAITIGERRTTFIGERLETLFPCCIGDVAYLGLPIFDSAGERVIGHIAFFDDKPRQASIVENPVFRILASRAGVELLRKRAEDDLRESEAKFRLLVENQTDLIVKLDLDGTCRFVSPSFCSTFGCEEDELLGRPLELELNALDRDAFAEARAAVRAHPHHGDVEVRVLTTGGWRWLAWAWSAVLDETGAVAATIGSARDVTERKRAEEQARQHLQSLAHVTRLSSLGEMASAIAHEVNQPLTAVVTYTQACMRLLRSGQATQEEVIEWMERVGHQAERASQIIRHLRTFVRNEDAQLAPVQMNYLVGEVVRLVLPDARQSAVEVVTDLADGLPAVLADNIQIQQVLLNLIRNGVEAINGGACAERRVVVRTARGADGMVEAHVSDSGPGFDALAAENLFEPFYTTKEQGMGIGLSISRSIAEAHGGRIRADAVVGGGACLTLSLPPVEAE